MNFVIDLAHSSLCGSVVEHRSAESEGFRFDSSWGLSFAGANGLIVTDPCGSNSSAGSEITVLDGRIFHNRINGFTICHEIFRTGFLRTPLPEFSTH